MARKEFQGAIQSVEGALEVMRECPHHHFRGQARIFPTLQAQVFRAGSQVEWERWEYFAFLYFKTAAPALEEKLPRADDHVEWLLWMQHHGAPTRLLDWTANILVALYFAVTEFPGKDGELWVLDPIELNKSLGFSSVLSIEDFPVMGLAQHVVRPWKGEGVPRAPVSFLPRMMFPQMFAQRSVFTIQPPPSFGTTLDDTDTRERTLKRYSVPSVAKDSIRSDLLRLGVTADALFPTLAGVARHIKTEAGEMQADATAPVGGNFSEWLGSVIARQVDSRPLEQEGDKDGES